jgi:hypothetical protein
MITLLHKTRSEITRPIRASGQTGAPANRLDDFHEITALQRREFSERGHLLVRNLLSHTEIDFFRPAICGAVRGFRTTM